MTYDERITEAARRGTLAGKAARGADECPSWLSGEWAGESINELLGDLLGDEIGSPTANENEDIMRAYEDAADTAFAR